MPKYRWEYKAIGEENQGSLPGVAYRYVRGQIDTNLEKYKTRDWTATKDKTVMGVDYSKHWKVTAPFRYLGRKLLGWGVKKSVPEVGQMAKDYLDNKWMVYKGDYVYSQLQAHNSGVALDDGLMKGLFKQTGFKIDVDGLMAELKAQLVTEPATAFYAEDWRTKVMPGMLKSIYEQQMDRLTASVISRYEEKGTNLPPEILRQTLMNGSILLGQLIQDYGEQIAGNTDLLNIPPVLFGAKLGESDVPAEFTPEQKKQFMKLKRPGLADEKAFTGKIDRLCKTYAKQHPGPYIDTNIISATQQLEIGAYDTAPASYLSTAMGKVSSMYGYTRDTLAPMLMSTYTMGASLFSAVREFTTANVSQYANQALDYVTGAQLEPWQQKIVGRYNYSFLNEATRDLVMGKVTKTLQDWKAGVGQEGETYNQKLFGKDYGEKHWKITAPFRYLGKKLMGWGLKKGYDAAENYLNPFFKGEMRQFSGFDVAQMIGPQTTGKNLLTDKKLSVDLYNLTGYQFSGEDIYEQIATEFAGQKGHNTAFKARKWREEVVPGMLKSIYEKAQKEMFDEIQRRFEANLTLHNRELYEKTLRQASENLAAIFEDYSFKLANNTELLQSPMRFVEDKAKDMQIPMPEGLSDTEKQLWLKNCRRPGITTRKALDKKIKAYTKQLKPNPIADEATMDVSVLQEKMGIVPEVYQEPGIVGQTMETIGDVTSGILSTAGTVLSMGTSMVTTVAQKVDDLTGGMISGSIQSGMETVNSVYQGTIGMIGAGVEGARQMISTSSQYVVDTYNSTTQYISDTSSSIWSGIKKSYNDSWNYVAGFLGYGSNEPAKEELEPEKTEVNPAPEKKGDEPVPAKTEVEPVPAKTEDAPVPSTTEEAPKPEEKVEESPKKDAPKKDELEVIPEVPEGEEIDPEEAKQVLEQTEGMLTTMYNQTAQMAKTAYDGTVSMVGYVGEKTGQMVTGTMNVISSTYQYTTETLYSAGSAIGGYFSGWYKYFAGTTQPEPEKTDDGPKPEKIEEEPKPEKTDEPEPEKTNLERIDDKMAEIRGRLGDLDTGSKTFAKDVKSIVAQLSVLSEAREICVKAEGFDKEPKNLDELLNDAQLQRLGDSKYMKDPCFNELLNKLTPEQMQMMQDGKNYDAFRKTYQERKPGFDKEATVDAEGRVHHPAKEAEDKAKEAEQKTEEEPKKSSGGFWSWFGY